MWLAVWHVLVRSFNATVDLFSTSKLAIAVTVAAALFPHVRVLWKEGLNMHGLRRVGANIGQDIGLGGLLVIAVWLIMISVSAVRDVYADHVTFVQKLKAERREAGTYQQKWQDDESKLKRLQQYPPVQLTKKDTVKKRCTAEDRHTYPDPKIQGALFATETIISCNYPLLAPFGVEVFYSDDILSGSVNLPSQSLISNGGGGKSGPRTIIGKYPMNSLEANAVIVVEAQAQTMVRSTEIGVSPPK